MEISAHLRFGPAPGQRTDRGGDWIDGSWPDLCASMTSQTVDGPVCFALPLLEAMTDLNLEMVQQDMEEAGFVCGDIGYKLLGTEIVAPIAVSATEILRFPVYRVRFALLDDRVDEFRQALATHLVMAELSLTSRADGITDEAWKNLWREPEAAGVRWSDVDTVILLNPQVTLDPST